MGKSADVIPVERMTDEHLMNAIGSARRSLGEGLAIDLLRAYDCSIYDGSYWYDDAMLRGLRRWYAETGESVKLP